MKTLSLIAAALIGALIAPGSPASAEARAESQTGALALVIGNHRYSHAPDAQSAQRDALEVARALRDAGYEVTVGFGLTRAKMRRMISDFAEHVPEADRVVIYYSGHALRSRGISFLAPIDQEADSVADVMFDGVPLDLLLEIAREKDGRAVVFVDAAQLDGFEPTDFAEPGLAEIVPPEGVMVISAAAPGRAIRRSPKLESRFARAIGEHFLLPGAVPGAVVDGLGSPLWAAGRLEEGFALVDPEPPIHADPDALEREIELAFWRAAERSGDPADYEEYLARYPDGLFVGIAHNRLASLGAGGSDGPAAPVNRDKALEDELGLSGRDRREVQRALTALGYDTRGIDGIFGRGTRRAIGRWQEANQFPVSGYLTNVAQVRTLLDMGQAAIAEAERRAEAERQAAIAADHDYWTSTGARGTIEGLRRYLERYPEGLHADEAADRLDRIAEAERAHELRAERRAWRRAVQADTAVAYRRYLARYQDGVFAPKARARIAKIEQAERNEAFARRERQREASLGLAKADFISVERQLRFHGYQPGRIDGVLDQQARDAIAAFQGNNGLDRTGFLNRRTLITLVRQTRAAQQRPETQAEAIFRLFESLANN